MLKKIFVPLMLSVSCALLLTACGGSDTSTTNNTSNTTVSNKTATTSTPTTTTTTPATTTPASGDKIGVAECDDYLAKYEACLSGKVPAQAKVQFEQALATTRKSWRDLAANPQTKSSLAQACKMANDQAKQSMKAYGCDF
jgi:leucyl-tRNA synthetase